MPPKGRHIPEGGVTILGCCDCIKGNCAPVVVSHCRVLHFLLYVSTLPQKHNTPFAPTQNEETGKLVRKLDAATKLWTHAMKGEKQVRVRSICIGKHLSMPVQVCRVRVLSLSLSLSLSHTHTHTHAYSHTYTHTHTCMHVHAHTCTHAHMHTRTHPHRLACTRTHMLERTCVSTHAQEHAHTCTNMHVCIYTCASTHVHVCMYRWQE